MSTPVDLSAHQNLPWQSYPNLIEATPSLDGVTPTDAASMLYQLLLIRSFEQWLVDNETLVHGPLHSSIGQEAVAVGAVAALGRQDQIASTHRAHHHVLARVVASAAHDAGDFDPAGEAPTPAGVRQAILKTMAEILGLRYGFAGGRGGSMHLGSIEAGVLGTSAIVGGGIPMSTGAAFSFAQRGSGGVALAFFGDGASSIGALHESMAMSRVMSLPMIFVVENNLYSVATTVAETVGFPDIAIRAAGHDMPGIIADGMDPLAVRDAVARARAHAAAGKGPVLIEAKTYRYLHQSGRLPGSDYRYRTKDEENEWMGRDPIEHFPGVILDAGLLGEAAIDAIRARVEADLAAAINIVVEPSDGGLRIRDSAWPDPTDALRGVRSETASPARGEELEASGEVVTYQQAISLVHDRAMQRDPEVFVIGEEVGHLRGGAYGTTRHVCRNFPERVFSSPISENGFSGLALGAAVMGMRPVVELMFPDFALEAADQLLNHVPKTRHMFGGEVDVPLVVRTRTAQGRGFGSQHSCDPAALFALFPGWRIVAPSTPSDYVGLFNSAITGTDPVLIIEHHRLWTMEGAIPDLDARIPLGRARVVRPGRDLTVLTWSHPLHRVQQIAESLSAEGIEAEIIDLRTIDPQGIDWELVSESVIRTRAVVIVEDATASHALGPRISQVINDRHFDDLRALVRLVTGKDVPAPVSKVLEEFILLSDRDIEQAIRATHRSSLIGRRG
jgi:2-oxoisovalerate dehydrogenase E1 component